MTQLFDTTTYDNDTDRTSEQPVEHTVRLVPVPQRDPVWQLDDETIAVGRLGLARARKALREAKAEPTGVDSPQPKAA